MTPGGPFLVLLCTHLAAVDQQCPGQSDQPTTFPLWEVFYLYSVQPLVDVKCSKTIVVISAHSGYSETH